MKKVNSTEEKFTYLISSSEDDDEMEKLLTGLNMVTG